MNAFGQSHNGIHGLGTQYGLAAAGFPWYESVRPKYAYADGLHQSKSVMHGTCRVMARNIQCFEVVIVIFNFWTSRYCKPCFGEELTDTFLYLGHWWMLPTCWPRPGKVISIVSLASFCSSAAFAVQPDVVSKHL